MVNRIKKILLLFITISIVLINSNVIVLAEEEMQTTSINENINNEEYNIVNPEVTNETNINNNSTYKCIIEDNANLLTDEEEKRLYEVMFPLTEYGHIMFKSIDNNDYTTSSYARAEYHEKFNTDSGTLFLIDMDNREIYIFSDGHNYRVINDNKAYSITDNVYRYASNRDYYSCASEAFKQMLELMKGNTIIEPMRYISNALISITIAAFINFFIVMRKSKIKNAHEKEILKNCKIDFNIGDITVRKSGTRRVYSPVSDSSGSSGGGGGGSSGGGGGGGSSGGGGGHGF